VGDEPFGDYRDWYTYDHSPLNEEVEVLEDVRNSSVGFGIERVALDAVYGSERFRLYLYLPPNVHPPYQTILFFPGSTVVSVEGHSDVLSTGFDGLPAFDRDLLGALVLSGRALVHPVYYGTYERNDGRHATTPEETASFRDWTIRQVQDALRSLDYLERARNDIDMDGLAYLGISWGSELGPLILAQEPRLKSAVFLAGGLSDLPYPPQVDPFHFAPRVSIPVLMINGDGDNIFPLETSQIPFFELLGTKEPDKVHLTYPAGHVVQFSYPNQVRQNILDWLDRTLGEVD
jgi:dienelactone hydrolase